MGHSNLGDRIGKFFFTLGFICAICIGLFRMCIAGVETLKEKVATSQALKSDFLEQNRFLDCTETA